jgi:hypothetical protein
MNPKGHKKIVLALAAYTWGGLDSRCVPLGVRQQALDYAARFRCQDGQDMVHIAEAWLAGWRAGRRKDC